MLRFAGYMVATAGGATGVWHAAGAATNAFVGFATNMLETSLHRGSREALEQLAGAAAGVGGGASGPGGRRGRGVSMELGRAGRASRLSNAHRHQEGLECLDLATPFPALLEADAAVRLVSDMMVMLLGVSCLYAASSVVHQWLRFIEEHPLPAAEEVEAAEAEGEEDEDEGMFAVDGVEEDNKPSSVQQRSLEAVLEASPFASSSGPVVLVQPAVVREGMHNSHLGSVSTIRRANSRTIPSARKRKPSIYDIRQYFLASNTGAGEGRGEGGAGARAPEGGPDPALLSVSAPAKSRNVYVPLADTFEML